MSVVDMAPYRARRHADREPWMSKRQLAEYLGFSTRWIELRMRDGMPYSRMGGQVRFQRASVEGWLRERAGGGSVPA